jgi:hypothetical protein
MFNDIHGENDDHSSKQLEYPTFRQTHIFIRGSNHEVMQGSFEKNVD